jgi:hypothetical protein
VSGDGATGDPAMAPNPYVVDPGDRTVVVDIPTMIAALNEAIIETERERDEARASLTAALATIAQAQSAARKWVKRGQMDMPIHDILDALVGWGDDRTLT